MHSPKPPLPKGGASACRGGGIPQAGRFPHRFVLSRSTSCESLSHGYAVPAPFGKGALRRAAADNAHGSFQRIVTAPPVPGIGGLPPNLFPIPSSLKSPSVKNQRFSQLPFTRELFTSHFDTKNRKGLPFRFWGYVYRGLILAL